MFRYSADGILLIISRLSTVVKSILLYFRYLLKPFQEFESLFFILEINRDMLNIFILLNSSDPCLSFSI